MCGSLDEDRGFWVLREFLGLHGFQIKEIGGKRAAGPLSFENLKIFAPVIVHEKHILTVVSPLCDVMYNMRHNDSGFSWHMGILQCSLFPVPCPRPNKLWPVPILFT